MIDIEYFRNKKLIIYGTGYVAHMFYKALEIHDLKENVQYCVITHVSRKSETFEGLQVYGIHDIYIDANAVVCIAVHETNKDEIETVVKNITTRYIWIYPYIYQLLMGSPLRKQAMISVERLLHCYKEDLRLAVRLAAIEQHDSKNDYGMQYYINAQRIYCEKDTAYKRLNKFIALMDEWRKMGYKEQFPITINSNYEVIDGDHRVSMAVYTGQKTICGNMYQSKMLLQEIHESGAIMSRKTLMRNGFNQKDIEILESIQWRYINNYE